MSTPERSRIFTQSALTFDPPAFRPERILSPTSQLKWFKVRLHRSHVWWVGCACVYGTRESAGSQEECDSLFNLTAQIHGMAVGISSSMRVDGSVGFLIPGLSTYALLIGSRRHEINGGLPGARGVNMYDLYLSENRNNWPKLVVFFSFSQRTYNRLNSRANNTAICPARLSGTDREISSVRC